MDRREVTGALLALFCDHALPRALCRSPEAVHRIANHYIVNRYIL